MIFPLFLRWYLSFVFFFFKEDSDFVDQSCAGCKMHTNFANEAGYLMADDVWNEVFTIYRPKEVLKTPSLYMQTFLTWSRYSELHCSLGIVAISL
jgi:hypothetical protein